MTSQLLAATSSAAEWDPTRVIALVVLAWLGWRLALVMLFPYGPHKPCKGSGKQWSRGNFRPCRGCQGTGRRLRLGRRVWEWTRS